MVRGGDHSALYIHSSFPTETLMQKLKLPEADVEVEQQVCSQTQQSKGFCSCAKTAATQVRRT